MRKILFLGTTLFLCSITFAAVNVKLPDLRADKVFIPISKTQKISYAELATISVSDLEALTGKKMNFFQRLNFRIAQSKIRKTIAADGTIKSKKIQKMFAKGKDGSSGFHLGGFALGFFVGLIGVLIAYLIHDDYKKNRVKWAWIGFGTFLVLWIILAIAIVGSGWGWGWG